MDNLGAIAGPLPAIGLIAVTSIRAAVFISVIPGLLSAVANIYAIRHTATPRQDRHQPVRITVRPLLRGPLGRLMIGVTAFEIGNCATTLLILRASQLFTAGHDTTAATQLALLLYIGYNIAAALISVPAGWHGDRYHPVRVLAAGAVLFAAGYAWFAVGSYRPIVLLPAFVLAGLGIGCGETAESAAVASLAPGQLRGSAFGLLATVQPAGNLIASSVAGLLWTAASPAAAFLFLTAAMLIAAALTLPPSARCPRPSRLPCDHVPYSLGKAPQEALALSLPRPVTSQNAMSEAGSPGCDPARLRQVTAALWLVSVSVAFGMLSGANSVTTGLADHSLGVLTIGLGVLADVAGSAVLIWRFRAERRQPGQSCPAEARAAIIVAIALAVVSVALTVQSAAALAAGSRPARRA